MSGNELFFSRIELLTGGPDVWNWDPYRSHQFLWDFFKNHPDQRRDFLYRFELNRGKPCYYVVSMRRPEERGFPWKLGIKPYNPVVRVGETLSFNLRVNPTVDTLLNGKKQRQDIIMARKRKLGEDWARQTTQAQLLQSEGVAWLTRKAELHGFQISTNSVRVDGYQQHSFHKASDPRGKRPPITVRTMDFHGVLKVTDPNRFRETLYSGVGRGKAFGCGLLLVKRR